MLERTLKDPRDQKIAEMQRELSSWHALVGGYMVANNLSRIEGPRPDQKQIKRGMNLILKTEGEDDEMVFVAEILVRADRDH